MKRFNTKLAGTIVVALALVSLAPVASALEPTVVTFDSGTEGWTANPFDKLKAGCPVGTRHPAVRKKTSLSGNE